MANMLEIPVRILDLAVGKALIGVATAAAAVRKRAEFEREPYIDTRGEEFQGLLRALAKADDALLDDWSKP